MSTKKMMYVLSYAFSRYSDISLQYIVIHRVEPKTQRGYVLVAHTAFQKGSKDAGYSRCITRSKERCLTPYSHADPAQAHKGQISSRSKLGDCLLR